MATTGVFNFLRLKEGCDPANAFESYEQDAHTLEVRNGRLLPQDVDILLIGSAHEHNYPLRSRFMRLHAEGRIRGAKQYRPSAVLQARAGRCIDLASTRRTQLTWAASDRATPD